MSGPLTHRPFANIDTARFERGERLWAQFLGHRPDCEHHADGVPHNPCWAWTNVEPPRAPRGAAMVVIGVNRQTGTVTVSALETNTKGSDE